MPVYLRKFYFNKLLELKKVEKDQIEKASKKQQPTNIPKPTFNPKFKR